MPEEYKLNYEAKGNKIIGYYYDSSVVKFIDEIKDGRIKKTTYYDKDNSKIIYEKNCFYDDALFIKSSDCIMKDSYGRTKVEVKSFFSRGDSKVAYCAYKKICDENTEQIMISDGEFSESLKPENMNTKAIVVNKKNNVSTTFSSNEKFSYEENGAYTHNIFINDLLQNSTKMYFKDGTMCVEESSFDLKGNIAWSKKYIVQENHLVQEFFTGDETTLLDYEYCKIKDDCYILRYIDWDKKPAVKINSFDEVVFLKDKNDKIRESLKLNVSVTEKTLF